MHPADTRTYKEKRADDMAEKRYNMALWYAFGSLDTERNDNVDPFEFATAHSIEARDYYSGETHYLPAVQHAWETYVKEHTDER